MLSGMNARFHRRTKIRGFKALVLVLLFSLLISSIFFVWTMSIQTPLLMLNRIDAQDQAQSAARYCLEWAHSNFVEKKTAFANDLYWGKETGFLEAPDTDSTVEPEVEEDHYGTLTFRQGPGDEPYSVNNLNGTSVITGWNGTTVPPGFVHLVSVGHHHGIEAVSEMLIYQQAFPFSVAAAGTLSASNLEVYSVTSLEAFEDGTVTDDEKLAGGLLSNSTSNGAVTLSGNSEVRGDVTTQGTVVTQGSASILGETIEGGDSQEIPSYRAVDFNPDGLQLSGPYVSGEIIEGARIHQGDLTLSGDLEFNDAMLYVNGNVTITGTLHGKGALVATGDIHVTTGQMDLANDINAMVAGGKITIDGLSQNNSTFKGIVYAEKSIEFRRTTVIGASVSADPNGSITMDEVKAVTAPRLDSMLIEKHVTLEEAMESGASVENTGPSDEEAIGILVNNTDFVVLNPSNEEALKALALTLVSESNQSTWEVVVQTGEPPPNEYQPAGEASLDAFNGFQKWEDYLLEHRDDDIRIEKIFEIDLNRSISLEGNIEVWHRKVQNYRKD